MTTVKVILGTKQEEVRYYGQGTVLQFNSRADITHRTGILCKPSSGMLVLIVLDSGNRWAEPFLANYAEKFTIKQLEEKLNINILFVAESAEIILK